MSESSDTGKDPGLTASNTGDVLNMATVSQHDCVSPTVHAMTREGKRTLVMAGQPDWRAHCHRLRLTSV